MKTKVRRAITVAAVSTIVWCGMLRMANQLWAQTPTTNRGCESESHRQFDFWVGHWEVTTADGVIAGNNRVEKILDGCVVKENWVGSEGMRGESYNIFSKRSGKWHQSWVDTTGRLLLLEGGLEDGKMVLGGQMPGRDGRSVRHEISWEVVSDGRVKQHWRASGDQGKTWNDVFVGFYARKE